LSSFERNKKAAKTTTLATTITTKVDEVMNAEAGTCCYNLTINSVRFIVDLNNFPSDHFIIILTFNTHTTIREAFWLIIERNNSVYWKTSVT
jgi:hypothetical protein